MTDRAYVRPPWAARVIGGRMARLFKPSMVSLLSVPGRTTGEWRSNSVVVLDHDGGRYLVSAYGDTEWSRNRRRRWRRIGSHRHSLDGERVPRRNSGGGQTRDVGAHRIAR